MQRWRRTLSNLWFSYRNWLPSWILSAFSVYLFWDLGHLGMQVGFAIFAFIVGYFVLLLIWMIVDPDFLL